IQGPSARRSNPAPAIRTMNARASGNASQRPAPFTESPVLLLAAKRKPPILLRSLGNRSPARCRPRAGDRDHDAFALGVLSSKSQKGRALLHSGHGRDRTPTCDLWHVRVVVLVMPRNKVEANHGIPGRNQSYEPGMFLVFGGPVRVDGRPVWR